MLNNALVEWTADDDDEFFRNKLLPKDRVVLWVNGSPYFCDIIPNYSFTAQEHYRFLLEKLPLCLGRPFNSAILEEVLIARKYEIGIRDWSGVVPLPRQTPKKNSDWIRVAHSMGTFHLAWEEIEKLRRLLKDKSTLQDLRGKVFKFIFAGETLNGVLAVYIKGFPQHNRKFEGHFATWDEIDQCSQK